MSLVEHLEGGEFPGTSNSLLSGAVIAWRARRAGNKGDLVLCWVGRHVLFLKKKKKKKKVDWNSGTKMAVLDIRQSYWS